MGKDQLALNIWMKQSSAPTSPCGNVTTLLELGNPY
jgi:hypothetical protein